MRGVKTNINFLKNVLSNPAFIKGAITTRFIDENPNLLRTSIQQNRAQKVRRWHAHRLLERGLTPAGRFLGLVQALHYLGNVIVNGPVTPLATTLKPALKDPTVPPLPGTRT